MNLLDRFLGRRPVRTNSHHPVISGSLTNGDPSIAPGVSLGTSYYEALRISPDRAPLPTSGSTFTQCADRIRLSEIARAIFDNNGWVGYAIEQTAIYCSPVWPQANSPSNDWNLAAEAYFRSWAEQADYYGRDAFDYAAQQAYISQAIDIDGDIGCVAVEEPTGIKLRLIPGPLIVSPADKISDEHFIDGVRLDSAARVIGYDVLQVSPNDPIRLWVLANRKTEFQPINRMTLLRDVRVTETYRGVSPLRRGANHVRDGNEILRFAKLAWKDYTSLRGVVEGGYLDEDHGFDLTDTDNPNPNPLPSTAAATGLGRMDMLGGDWPVLPPGKTLKRFEGQPPSGDVEPFLDSLASLFSAGLLIPPAFFLDSKLTGPNVRGVNGKAQRRFNQRRLLLARFVRWTWIRVMGNAIATKQLPSQAGWDLITFQFPPDISIDAGDDAANDREDIASGSKSRQEVTGKRGRDWQRVADQIFAEDEYIITKCKEQSTSTGIPLEILLQRHGIMTRPQPSQPAQTSGAARSTQPTPPSKP